MRVVILGCGRVGARLANALDREGHTVSIIDRSADAFRRLLPEFQGNAVLGLGIDEDVLRRAGLESADIFITVTNEDNANIMAAQIAREIFRVPKVITRVYDPSRAEIFRSIGLEVVCPTSRAASHIRDLLVRGFAERTSTPAGMHPGG